MRRIVAKMSSSWIFCSTWEDPILSHYKSIHIESSPTLRPNGYTNDTCGTRVTFLKFPAVLSNCRGCWREQKQVSCRIRDEENYLQSRERRENPEGRHRQLHRDPHYDKWVTLLLTRVVKLRILIWSPSRLAEVQPLTHIQKSQPSRSKSGKMLLPFDLSSIWPIVLFKPHIIP